MGLGLEVNPPVWGVVLYSACGLGVEGAPGHVGPGSVVFPRIWVVVLLSGRRVEGERGREQNGMERKGGGTLRDWSFRDLVCMERDEAYSGVYMSMYICVCGPW